MYLKLIFCLIIISGTGRTSSNNNVITLPDGTVIDIQEWIDSILDKIPGRPSTTPRTTNAYTSGMPPADVLDLKLYPGEECLRTCAATDRRICYFKFTLEHYQAMGAACKQCAQGVIEDCNNPSCITVDGIERGLMSINRQVPGPALHVCKDDLIVVDVTNKMAGTAATIHWHGFHHRDTPFMDGVPYVTQCPIDFSTSFRYAYWATQAGTQFYHSHTGHHKVNGHFGGIIVREPPNEDVNTFLYDEDLQEHMVILADWMHEDGEMFMPGNPTRGMGIQPNSLLINGKGTFTDTTTNTTTNVPLAVFRVSQGQKYRFRVINAASHVCPFEFQIEGHSMTIIASDSYPVQPKPIDTLYTESGERYDFVLNANQTKGDYWIRLRAIGPCNGRDLQQFAVLSYSWDSTVIDTNLLATPDRPKPKFSETYNQGRSLNNPNATCYNNNDDDYCVADLQAHQRELETSHGMPDHRFFLGFDNYRVDTQLVYRPNNYDYHFMNTRNDVVLIGAVNNLTFNFPPISLLSQTDEIREDMFCNSTHRPPTCEGLQICPCVHRIKIELHSLVELIIVDETEFIRELNHPFHLHGYGLYVVGMGQHPLKIPMTVRLAQTMFKTKRLPVMPLNSYPPQKDTVSVPSRGFTVVRFRADNPGFWLMHCHFEWHMAVGMGLVLQVGETSQMPKPPPNFPKCGNYLPDIDSSVLDHVFSSNDESNDV